MFKPVFSVAFKSFTSAHTHTMVTTTSYLITRVAAMASTLTTPSTERSRTTQIKRKQKLMAHLLKTNWEEFQD